MQCNKPRKQLVRRLTRSPHWQGRAASRGPAWRSPLQLAFELVEESPIRAVGNDPVGARLDQAALAQPQRIEPDRILSIVLPPLVVREFLQRLERVVVEHSMPRNTSRLEAVA